MKTHYIKLKVEKDDQYKRLEFLVRHIFDLVYTMQKTQLEILNKINEKNNQTKNKKS